MRRVVAQLALILVGLVIVVYPLTLGAHDGLVCRGVPMQPGGVCVKSDGIGVQTYEQRARAARESRPIIISVGVAVVAFGGALLVTERRRIARAA